MGKIYEFSEIANRRIPHPSDFLEAKRAVLDRLSLLSESGEICGAKVFGSVAKGTPSERSDFDLIVITRRDSSLGYLQKLFQDVRVRTNVGIEPIIIQKKFATEGTHSVDELFLDHIRSIPNEGNLVGQDPSILLQSNRDLSPAMVYKQYLIQKLRRFNEGFIAYSEADRCKVLQRALEEPVNLGRRTLQILPHFAYPVKMDDDGKQNVIRLFRETFKRTNLVSGFDSLLAQDEDYTKYLKETLQYCGPLDQRGYEAKLNELNKCIPQALAWTGEMARICLRLIEGNNRRPEGNTSAYRRKEF